MAISLLQYHPAQHGPGGGHPAVPTQAPTAGTLFVERIIELDSTLPLELAPGRMLGEGWSSSPSRQLLPVPGAPGWLVVVHARALWLLWLGGGTAGLTGGG